MIRLTMYMYNNITKIIQAPIVYWTIDMCPARLPTSSPTVTQNTELYLIYGRLFTNYYHVCSQMLQQ